MEREREMKTAILAIGVLVLMASATQASNVPKMPQYDTQAERECARDCQSVHIECTAGCIQIIERTPRGDIKRVKCLDGCNHALEECYASCEGAE